MAGLNLGMFRTPTVICFLHINIYNKLKIQQLFLKRSVTVHGNGCLKKWMESFPLVSSKNR